MRLRIVGTPPVKQIYGLRIVLRLRLNVYLPSGSSLRHSLRELPVVGIIRAGEVRQFSHRVLPRRADCDIISVRVPERELRRARARIQVRLLFEPGDKRPCPFQRLIVIVHPEEQEKAVARRRLCGPHQRRMGMRRSRSPLPARIAHSWRQSRTVPSVSRICPKSSCAGAVSGKPKSD